MSTPETTPIETQERRLPPDWRPEFVESVSKARPLAIFIGVSFLLTAGLVLLGGGGMIAFVQDSPIASLIRALGVLYLVMAPVIAMPSLFLLKYATAAKRYREIHGPIYLEEALREHARFWTYAGVVTIVGVIIELWIVGMIYFIGGSK